MVIVVALPDTKEGHKRWALFKENNDFKCVGKVKYSPQSKWYYCYTCMGQVCEHIHIVKTKEGRE